MPIHRIPQSQEGLNHSEKRVLEAITQFFGNPARDVFIYLQPRIQNKEPDFIIVDENCGVIIVEVKAWKLSTIQQINDDKVVLAGGDQTDNPAYKTQQYHKLTERDA